jgi:outer membrane lipoprotein
MHAVIPTSSFGVLLVALLLGACASSPTYDAGGGERGLTPRDVIARPETTTGRNVLWGGVILSTVNLEDSTQIEVLAYPLDTDARPRTDHAPQGRFILERAGQLDPADYAAGRLITVAGTVTGIVAGRVGEADYTYPVIHARQLTQWPVVRMSPGVRPFFSIGVGSGGSWGSGIGVGF